MPVVLFSTLFLTAVNIIASLFWYPAFRFTICRDEFERKFTLPHGLRLTHYRADYLNPNLGTVVTDQIGEPILYKGMQLPPSQGEVEALSGFTIQHGFVEVVAELSTGDAIRVKIDADHSLTRVTDAVPRRNQDYIDLKSAEVSAWLAYRDSYHPDFWLFTSLFVLSIGINAILARALVRIFMRGYSLSH